MGGVRDAAAVRRRRLRQRRPGQPARRARGGRGELGSASDASSCTTSAVPPDGVRRDHRRRSASTTWPRARGSSTRSRSAPRRRTSASSTRRCTGCSTRSRSTGSTTSSARRRRRTCTCCGSPTACSTRVWNREHVAPVQIDVPEKLDITDRAEFYDATGAVLDMLVTHLFQVAAEVAMEPPAQPVAPTTCRPPARRSSAAFRPLDPRRGRARPVRRATATSRASPTTRAPTRSSPPGCGSTPTAGAACRSCCGPASGWPSQPAGQPGPARPGRAVPGARRRGDAATRPRGNVLRFDLAGDGALATSMHIEMPGARSSSTTVHGQSRSPTPAATRCRRTCGSSTTSCWGTGRCSPGRTGSRRSGTRPALRDGRVDAALPLRARLLGTGRGAAAGRPGGLGAGGPGGLRGCGEDRGAAGHEALTTRRKPGPHDPVLPACVPAGRAGVPGDAGQIAEPMSVETDSISPRARPGPRRPRRRRRARPRRPGRGGRRGRAARGRPRRTPARSSAGSRRGSRSS